MGHKDWIYHAKSRPAMAENMAIQRVADLMKIVEASVYIVNASTADSVRIIANAKADGLTDSCGNLYSLSDAYG